PPLARQQNARDRDPPAAGADAHRRAAGRRVRHSRTGSFGVTVPPRLESSSGALRSMTRIAAEQGFAMRHLLDIPDLSADEISQLLSEAARLKAARRIRRSDEAPLRGRVVGLVFEKPSLRTRVSFASAPA